MLLRSLRALCVSIKNLLQISNYFFILMKRNGFIMDLYVVFMQCLMILHCSSFKNIENETKIFVVIKQKINV